jgi:hypothetical protein
MNARMEPPAAIPAEELARRRDGCAALADLWSTVASGPALCAPGCACGAGAIFSVGAGDIEADVMAFLAARFPPQTAPDIARVIASRSLEAGWGPAPFAAWLQGIADAPFEAAAFDILTGSLLTILQSLIEPTGPTGRFVCT